MNKTAIKNFAIWARVQLIEAAKQKAFEYEITENGENKPVVEAIGGRLLSKDEKKQRRQLIEQIRQKGYSQVMEEAAYTWFNRFIALRFMEVNGYLPSKVRVFTDENGAFKPEILKQAMTVELDGLDRSKVFDLLDKQNNEELYKYLLITQCNALSDGLPYMFEKIANWTELLFPDNLLRSDSVIGKMVTDISAEDWSDEVEIIGWMYQYYISEKHEEVVDPLHGKTVKKEDIPAATQLFTTDWVVRYILDNSLGRYWIERHPESKLADKLIYFVTPKDGGIPTVDDNIKPEELKVLDPCVGSGHFLSYAFDILLEIYRECGWSDRDAAKSIVENNLFGLDIDDRAAQLACFAVMMKARKYNRRIISSDTNLHIMAMQDSTLVSDELIRFVAKNDASIRNDLNELRILFNNAKEYGSIINVPKIDYSSIYTRINEIESEFYGNLTDLALKKEASELLLPLVKQAEILSGKYDVVATNPPYMNKYSARLKAYIAEHFEAYKGDLFSVFIYRNFGFCKPNGYSGFMTPNVWMFIKSYEDLREYIIRTKSITTLIQMAKGAFFKEATVDICAFVLKNAKENAKGLYFRLEDFKGDMEVQKQKVLEAIANRDCGYYYEANETNFFRIPGTPISFWVSETLYQNFENPKIQDIEPPRFGMSTSDNNRFVRIWYEVSASKFAYPAFCEGEVDYTKKWYPYNNGGEFRRWYGDNGDVVNWKNDGREIKAFGRAAIRNKDYYYKAGITWTAISSAKISVRAFDYGFLFSSAGFCIFEENLKSYILAFMNSKVGAEILRVLSPTINFNVGDIARLPIKVSPGKKGLVDSITANNISITRSDWDAFETSWDFKKHPLV